MPIKYQFDDSHDSWQISKGEIQTGETDWRQDGWMDGQINQNLALQQ